MNAVELRIYGRVQGVGYRGWTVKTARELGLRGWVRNRRDGTVEALIAGQQAQVQTMIQACWQGPSAADVTDIQIATVTVTAAPAGFTQLATY